MPKTLNGKKLTKHEHEIWREAYESAKGHRGARDAGAIATAAVKKYRGGRKK